jgi:hypothetical protein
MGVLTLNIECHERGVKKTMQFEPRTLVHDACRMVRDKLGPMSGNPNDYGLFRVEDDPTKCVWMENGRTLEYYLIRNGDTLEYKNKIRSLRVRTLDGGAVKTIFVDESQPVSQLMVVICSKMGISNHEEYSLVRGSSPILNGIDENGYGRDQHQIQRNDRERTPYANGTDQYEGGARGLKGKGTLENTFMNTIGRKKERQIQQLRAKLHTEEEIHWIDHSKTLREQNVGDEEELTLRRKFFFSDTNVDTRDPVQLNLLYIQCRDGVLRGLHPVSRDTAIKLAALQCYIEYGPFEEGIQKNVDAKNLLPKEYSRAKELEKNIIQEYRELIYEDSAAPKKKYCELCQSLPTYGVSFFLVKEKMPGKNKLIPRLLGVNKESVMRVDERTKAVLKEWPLEQVRRWAASYKTFTLDFGDYKDGYYSIQTLEGERIGQLIGGYIDIILKKKRIVDHTGIEGDEGATMVEDIVAPARATLLAHSEPIPITAQEPGGTMYGVYRPDSGTPPQAPQYGGVSGMILSQGLPKGEDIRYLDARERSQRALVGTIEATIRAVEEAEDEIAKPPHIDLPRFGETQRHWRLEVEKESVGDRLAAMGAATAEVVQLTAIPEESSTDTRVGDAIATIGSNLPEMGRGVRELAALMPDEHRAGDLVDAARKLCNAFGNFLDKVHPEHQEKRANILSAASRVGELSNDVLSTIQERTDEELSFHEELNRKARAVATSTAQLVLQAKTVSADCDDPVMKDQVIQSAMKTAYATSELVACTRVVGPTIEHQPCKEHLTDAAHNVARAVHELLEDASKASQRAPREKAENFENLRDSASRVTTALDDIIGHVQVGPWGYHRKTQQDYTFEQIVESSNRILSHPGGAPPELFRYSETAIRNSQMLLDGMEQEANQLNSVQQRERLLNAARNVAQATSSMIDATKECQSRPGEVEPQLALRSATSQLVQATSHATIDRQIRQTIQHLEKTAKEIASATTQTIAAVNSARPHIHNEQILQVLVHECVNTGRYVPPLVQRIKENQNAKNPIDHFKAHVGLIHECQAFIQPSTNLADISRSAVSYVEDKHASGILLRTSQQLSVYVAELRTAINSIHQLDFEPYLEHSEEFISSLDYKLQEIALQLRSGSPVQHSCPSLDIEVVTNSLRKQSRLLNSAVAQMVSSAYAIERRQVGIAFMEMVQSLGDFTESITDFVAASQERKDELHALESFILNARSVVHDSGRIFDRIREHNSQQLEEAARNVTESLRRTLNALPSDLNIEQNNSSIVLESTKQFVAEIRDDNTPGQADLDHAIDVLSQLIQQVDNACIAAANDKQPRVDVSIENAHQQILHSSRQMLDLIDPLKIAAISHADDISRNVCQQLASAQTLTQACIQSALLSYDSRTQASLFEQCKTVLESSIQLMFATKDSGGNPKAIELHTIVEESADQQKSAILDLQRLIQQLDTESGLMNGLIDGISRSIAIADQTQQITSVDTLADIQARMVSHLNLIGQTASDVPLVKSPDIAQLGQLFLQIDEHFRSFSEDSRIAQNLMISSVLGQRLKSSVQNLGMACIELIKIGTRRHNFPNDQRLFHQLSQQSLLIEQRIREVLVILSEGAQGTQACINAAQTVSGIIGDLNTTIMFATSGSLNPPISHELTTVSPPIINHRDVILRTAKALFEDTKALVSGAASNQEQLAVAAQNSVRSILQLTEAVKTGVSQLSPDSIEAQVMMIHAVRDVASALSNLIQATTHASGRNHNDPAIGNLKEAAKVMVSNVSSLLKAIKTIEDSSQRGAQALEASINAIDLAVKQYNNNENFGHRIASGEDVIRASRAATVAAEKAAGSASLLHQENVIAASNLARHSVSDLLGIVKTAANSANPELRQKMLNSGREVALQLKNLLANILQLYSRPDHPATKLAVLAAAREISKLVGQLSHCGEQLHSSSPITEERPLDVAENELLGAASSIEAVSNKLSQLRPRQVHKSDEDLENLPFDEQILSAAKSITTAVKTLVKAAYSAQRELISQGRMSEPSQILTKDEQYWTEGLVSAAILVAAATSQLCEAANGVVQGHSTEEKLIAAAKQVASSTAHLLVACKVKSDIGSSAMQRLQSAGHAVKVATEHLVNAARQAITENDCRGLIISDRMVTGIAQVMDAQEEVLRKERELTEARNRLTQLNKSRYEKSPEPSPEK